MDKSAPSTNAVAASNLFRLGALLDDRRAEHSHYARQARETVAAFEAEILQYPWLFVGLLTSVVTARLGVKKVRVRADDHVLLRAFHTFPRAEASALLLVGVGGRRPAVRQTAEEAAAEAEALTSKIEEMSLGTSQP